MSHSLQVGTAERQVTGYVNTAPVEHRPQHGDLTLTPCKEKQPLCIGEAQQSVKRKRIKHSSWATLHTCFRISAEYMQTVQ